ncbi:MAG: alpha-amylase, partial [Ignavibacteriae bacterium]|nr:alpha-amylase [Ignavibacteriota bacterium]
LIYSGQEAGLDKSLSFFDKDLIFWKEHKIGELYKKLFCLKHNNQALWNGKYGGEMVRIFNDCTDNVISFYREMNGDMVISIINFSNKSIKVKIQSDNIEGKYLELFSDKEYILTGTNSFSLSAWGYLLFTRNESKNQ